MTQTQTSAKTIIARPTLKTFRVDGYCVHWPPNFSWNGNAGPEVYAVMIDRIEDIAVSTTWPDGKVAQVWFRTSERPSCIRPRGDALSALIGSTPAIEDTNTPPHRIHKTREAAIAHVIKIGHDRIADIENQLKKHTHV